MLLPPRSLACGCEPFNISVYRKILDVSKPSSLLALPAVNKLLVLHEMGLYSFSIDVVARGALGTTSPQSLLATGERIASDVLFFRAGRVGNRLVGESPF